MDLKEALTELSEIAQELAIAPVSEALDLSGRVLASSLRLVEASSEDESPERVATTFLDENMEAMAKKRAWWMPPRNFLINQALTGYNFWRFTVLPMFPKKTAYNEGLGGIVIHPIWTPADDRLFRDLDLELAQKLVAVARKSPTVQDDVRQELAWMEREFSIRIPENIKGQIVKDALPMAKRRWGVDRLRVKDRLVPLDGSPPRDL